MPLIALDMSRTIRSAGPLIHAFKAALSPCRLSSLRYSSSPGFGSSKLSSRTRRSSPSSQPSNHFQQSNADRPQHHHPPGVATSMAHVPRVLITGGMGQLGRSLAATLSSLYGRDSVLLTDICKLPSTYQHQLPESPPSSTTYPTYRYLNILDRHSIDKLVVEENIDTLVHFSALLSAVSEQNVELALEVNCRGVENILNAAKSHQLKLFIPSTIGVFGTTTPPHHTPDVTVQRPRTIYGVSKVYAELLGEYYFERYGVDFRSLRLPGIISDSQPGGGTTDYTIQMFFDALLYGRHKCYLRPDTQMPMMFGDDCMVAIAQFLLAPSERLSKRTYNITGFSITPQQLAECIHQYLPDFQIHYDVCPVRQKIADSWPKSLDDTNARRDWAWCPQYSLESTVDKMMELVSHKLGKAMPVRQRVLNKEEIALIGDERQEEEECMVHRKQHSLILALA